VAHRCEDVSAWSRAFLSAAGPHPTTRLVLAGHRQFMKRDGSGCWVGVRRLAIVTGLDKSTVAKHRALAIATGWLIVSARSARSRYRTYLAAVPDEVPIPQSRRTQLAANVSRLSELTGQSSRPRLSGFTTSTVRPEQTHCPTPPDITLVLTSKETLAHQTVGGATEAAPSSAGGNPADCPSSAVDQLRRWLKTDVTAGRFRSYNLLVKLTPAELRFDGYEEIIRERTKRLLEDR
jgi:hypothetical protein